MVQRCAGRTAAQPRHRVHCTEPGVELPGIARESCQPARQSRSRDAAVPSRGACSRDRPWLGQGHRQADGRARSCECRPDARDDGDLQRVLRSRADAGDGRRRPDGCGPAHIARALVSQRARPGRARTRLRQVGRPAVLAAGHARSATARQPVDAHGANGAVLRLDRPANAGRPASGPAGRARRRPLRACSALSTRRRRRASRCGNARRRGEPR